MTRIILICLGFFLLESCNDKKEKSRFSELLSGPPYTSVSDSIDRFPKDPELYFRRAVLLNQHDQTEPALEDFRTAWSLQSGEKYALGVATLLLEKNPDSAAAFLQTALSRLPQSMLLKLALARSLDQQNKTPEALQVCDEMLRTNPDQPDVLKLKANLQLRTNNPAGALETMHTAYALTPFDLELNYMLALRLAEDKNPQVLRLCDSLLHKDSAGTLPDPYYYKGIYYSNTGNAKAAVEQFDQAIKVDYYFLEAYIEKGSVYFDQKKYTEALAVFKLANTLRPAWPDAWYWMAKTQEAMGDKENAKLNYQKTLGLDKNFTEAQEGLNRLKN